MGNIIQPPIPLEKLLFLRACTLNNLPEVKSLLAGGADVNWRWRNNGGWSGLHLAAVHNYQELLELLLAQPNLDVNISDGPHAPRTALMEASERRHYNIVTRLCQVPGIDIDSGLNCVLRIVSSHHLDIVKTFTSCGAKVGWEQILLSTNCRDQELRMKIVEHLLEFYQPSIDDINITNNPELVETLKTAASTPYSLKKLCRMSIRDNLGRAGRGADIRPLVGKLEGIITKHAMDFIINI